MPRTMRSHVLVLSIMPIIFNAILTPAIVMILVGFREFAGKPVYYIFLYGPYLWSIYDVAFAYLAYIFLKSEGEDVRRILGGVRDKPLPSILIAIGLIAISMTLSYTLSTMFGGNSGGSILKTLPPFTTLYLATIGSMIAGICEEFTWRGYILTRLEKITGKTVMAILIQATLFGLYHGFTINAIYTTIFGIITGTIYAKTRRLIPIMMGHWLNNTIGFTITYLT